MSARWYLSFGGGHQRRLDRISIGPNGIVRVEAKTEGDARRIILQVFGDRWSNLCSEDEMVWTSGGGHEYFPDGIVAVLSTDARGYAESSPPKTAPPSRRHLAKKNARRETGQHKDQKVKPGLNQ